MFLLINSVSVSVQHNCTAPYKYACGSLEDFVLSFVIFPSTPVTNIRTYPWRVLFHSWSDHREFRPLVRAIIADLCQGLSNCAGPCPASTRTSCHVTPHNYSHLTVMYNTVNTVDDNHVTVMHHRQSKQWQSHLWTGSSSQYISWLGHQRPTQQRQKLQLCMYVDRCDSITETSCSDSQCGNTSLIGLLCYVIPSQLCTAIPPFMLWG